MGIADSTPVSTDDKRQLAILGGTFDPIHNGHLWLAQQAVKHFSVTVRLIPNGQPRHRVSPMASWQHRINMCRLATANMSQVEIGTEEVPGEPRYSVDTLSKLRSSAGQYPLLLIVGSDAFSTFQQWHRWQAILKLANIVVARRSGFPASVDPLSTDYQWRIIDRHQLMEGVGGIYSWQCAPPTIAARDIRNRLAAEVVMDKRLPVTVNKYLIKYQLYGLKDGPIK